MQEAQVKEVSSNLTISDMRVISTLIEGAAAKGLIRPETYTTFGSIYDKIQALLKTEHDFNS
jgi:hypothetical protein